MIRMSVDDDDHGGDGDGDGNGDDNVMRWMLKMRRKWW